MSPSVAPLVVVPGKLSGTAEAAVAATVIEAHARCIPLPADSAVSRQRFLFSLAVISRFSAGIATPKADSIY